MARIIFDKKERIIQRIGPYVRGHTTCKTNLTSIARELGISPQAVSQKAKSNNFTIGDLITIFDLYNTPDEDVLWLLGRRG